MCRLLFMDKEGYNDLGENKTFELMCYLEKRLGGHGNGLLLIKNNDIIYYKKGVKYKPEDAIIDINEYNADYILWHTRLASVGEVNNKNCHPFVTKDNTFALMMNGTERQIGAFSNILNKTDTELIFDLINNYNLDISVLRQLSSNFIGYQKGIGTFVVNNAGLEYLINKGFVIASEFPNEWYQKYDVGDLRLGLSIINDKYDILLNNYDDNETNLDYYF